MRAKRLGGVVMWVCRRLESGIAKIDSRISRLPSRGIMSVIPAAGPQHGSVATQTQQTHHKRRSIFSASLLVGVLLCGVLPGTASSASATRRVVKPKKVAASTNYAVAIRTDAITTTPSSQVDYTVLVTKGSGLKGAIRFDVPDLPSAFQYTVTPLTSTTYRLRVVVPASAVASSTVYVLRALNGDRERAVLFRLTIQVPTTTTTATTPTTTPSTTTSIPVALTIRSDVTSRIASQGETVAFPIIVDRRGYTGPVDFIAAGLPAGSTAGYSPNPSVGNTTLYITPQDTTPSGRSIVVVTAKVGNFTSSIAVQLTVRRTGAFTTFIGPTNLKVAPGNDANFRLVLGTASGPIPFVDLQASGIPAGAILRSVDAVKAENLFTISTTAATPVGVYPISLTLTSGTFVKKLSVSLTVEAGLGFSLTPESSGVVVARGATIPLVIKVGATGGFSSALTYSVTGLPVGIQASYELGTGSATLKFSAAVNAPVGTFPVTILATGGGLSATIIVNVLVS
jgi:hypothetical protein